MSRKRSGLRISSLVMYFNRRVMDMQMISGTVKNAVRLQVLNKMAAEEGFGKAHQG